MNIYNGLIIKESLNDDSVLDYINIDKIELWNTDKQPKYWTAITFSSSYENLPILLSKSIISSNKQVWYIDLKSETTKYIVLKDIVLKYKIGNNDEKEKVLNLCRQYGIDEKQLDWSE